MDGQFQALVVVLAVAVPAFVLVQIYETISDLPSPHRRRRVLRRLAVMLTLSLLPVWLLAYLTGG